jgi:vacuolar-type H+-ATPase subunit E/Vma4
MEPQLQRIVDKILLDASEEARRIVEGARMSAEATLEQQTDLARQKASREASTILKKAEEEKEVIGSIEASEASRKATWTILSEKERLITEVLDEVRRRLAAFSRSEEYRGFLQRTIADAGIVLGGGKLEVLLNKRDSALPLNSAALARAISKQTGTRTELELSKDKIRATGGAVVKRIDGKILVDNTFEAMLGRSEKRLRLEIAKILFE